VKPEAQIAHRPFAVGESERLADGEDGCIIAYGPMVYAALEVRRRIAESRGLSLAVINARFVKPLDEAAVLRELKNQPAVFTLEDHAVAGGFGAAVAELALTRGGEGIDAGRIEILGLPDRFIDHGERTQQLTDAGLDVDSLTSRIAERLAGIEPRPRSVRLADSA
jgi:1-deoxy-D-xylulose-5-phosphate synthase